MTELLRFLYTDSNLPLQSMPSKISWLDEGAIFVTYIEIHSEKKDKGTSYLTIRDFTWSLFF